MFDLTENDILRFHAYHIKGDKDACWNWQASCGSHGYGQLRVNGTAVLAHRIAYYLAFGVYEANLIVCHKCDNRKCCNPSHLFVGTDKDNAIDKMNKGRCGDSSIPWDDAEIEEIIRLRNSLVSQEDIAKKFNVGQMTISRLLSKLEQEGKISKIRKSLAGKSCLSDDQIKQAINLSLEGLSNNKIAKLFDVSGVTIGKILTKHFNKTDFASSKQEGHSASASNSDEKGILSGQPQPPISAETNPNKIPKPLSSDSGSG